MSGCGLHENCGAAAPGACPVVGRLARLLADEPKRLGWYAGGGPERKGYRDRDAKLAARRRWQEKKRRQRDAQRARGLVTS